jgi:hypothetical protein
MSQIWDVNTDGQFVVRGSGDLVEPSGTVPVPTEIMPDWLYEQHFAREYPPDPSIPHIGGPIGSTTPGSP